jgi:predicted ATPase
MPPPERQTALAGCSCRRAWSASSRASGSAGAEASSAGLARSAANSASRTRHHVEGGFTTARSILRAFPGRASTRTTVGRQAERARLEETYARVAAGTGAFVAVTGEPGIGKTSLIEDFLDDLSRNGTPPAIMRGRCSESLAGSEAYLPLLDAIAGMLHSASGARFERVVQAAAPTWHAQIAALPIEAASQERMKRELAALLVEISRERPAVIVVDDLHWADVSTVDALSYLAGRFADVPVLVLTGYRPTDMTLVRHPFVAIRHDMQARGRFEEIPLTFLEPADVERYLAVAFPGRTFPRGFAAAIHARTEGSPLFMADLARWIVARGAQGLTADLPQSLRGMIARKIDQVGDEDRWLLLAASVQGSEFDSTTLADVLGKDTADVEERLVALERVQVFVSRAGEIAFPDGTLTVRYRFVHVLYQNALYESLQPTRRVALARAIAATLVRHHGSETAPIAARLAVLYETARDFAASARYFLGAAQGAVALFAFREALTLAERGLDGVLALPLGPERHQLELGLQMIRGVAMRSVRGWAAPELESTFTRARALCQALGDTPELFPVLWNLTFFNMIRGNVGEVAEQTAALMRQAEQSGQRPFQMAAHHLAGVTAEFAGAFPVSHQLLEAARELHDPFQHKAYNRTFGIDPGMVARAMSARPLWALGFPDRAMTRGRETIAIGRAQRQPVTFVFALLVAQGVHLYRGEADEALTLGQDIIALCDEYEFPQEAEWARGFQGSAMAFAGRTAEGAEQLRAALAALHALRSGLTRTMFLSLYADALVRDGRPDEGLAVIAEGVEHAERTGEHGFLAELHRLRGALLLMHGDEGSAEAAFRSAIDVARRQQARAFELRAVTALARLLRASGQTSLAREALEPLYASFTEGHETADLRAARALLSETGP